MHPLTSLFAAMTTMSAAGDPFYCWFVPCP